jgi:hypothetical protein
VTTRLTFTRWVQDADPDGTYTLPIHGHTVEVGEAVFAPDGHAVWVDAPLRIYDADLRRGWYLPDVLRRFRPGRTATAYGDPWCYTVARTPHGFPISALGVRAESGHAIFANDDPPGIRFGRIVRDPVGDAILETGTDCRTDAERERDLDEATLNAVRNGSR